MAKHTTVNNIKPKVSNIKPKAKKGEPEGKAKKKAKTKAKKNIPTHPDHNLRFESITPVILQVSRGSSLWRLPARKGNALPCNILLAHKGDVGLRCCTKFISAEGHKYRAHPSIYNGQPWHDHTMVGSLPAFIHTFIDLRDLPPITRINIPKVGQEPIKAGMYALVHSLIAIDEEKTKMDSNTMIGVTICGTTTKKQYTQFCS